MLEVLVPIIDEKLYDSLRTKKQLGYYVGCSRKMTCGIHGISFVVQSAEFSPILLEAEVLKFIDHFYHKLFTEETFNKYKKGTLNRLKASSSGLEREADDLFSRITNFSLDPAE